MKKAFFGYIFDLLLWAFLLGLSSFLQRAGFIDNAAFSLAGVALLFSIRANSKIDVITTHKTNQGN